jgi:hypothetical protein
MKRVKTNRKLFTGAALVAVLATLGVVQGMLDKAAAQANRFRASKLIRSGRSRCRENYVFGQTIGLGISADDHVWIIHRGNDPGNLDRTEISVPRMACHRTSMPAIPRRGHGIRCRRQQCRRMGRAGRRRALRGPESNHGLVVDHKGSCGSAATAPAIAHPEVHIATSKFVAAVGKPGSAQGSQLQGRYRTTSRAVRMCRTVSDMESFGRVAKIFIIPKGERRLQSA